MFSAFLPKSVQSHRLFDAFQGGLQVCSVFKAFDSGSRMPKVLARGNHPNTKNLRFVCSLDKIHYHGIHDWLS